MDLRRLSGLYHSPPPPPSLRLVECTQLKEGRKEVCGCGCGCGCVGVGVGVSVGVSV